MAEQAKALRPCFRAPQTLRRDGGDVRKVQQKRDGTWRAQELYRDEQPTG